MSLYDNQVMHTELSVRHGNRNREPFSHYVYDVLDGEEVVGILRHDYRGEAPEFRGPAGKWFILGASVVEVLAGGGADPLTLRAGAQHRIRTILNLPS